MDNDFYDLHVLPPNPSQEQKDHPIVIENMTKDATVEFLKRVIAKKTDQSVWREIKLYFLGEVMIDSEKLGSYELADKDCITAVSAVDVRQPPRPESKKVSQMEATVGAGRESEAKGRTLNSLAFKSGDRTFFVKDVDLSTTFSKLRERAIKEGNLEGMNVYFVFGSKKLDEYRQLEIYGLHENATIWVLERLLGGGDAVKPFS